MNILLFGGNSQRNKEWIHELGDVLSPDFNNCVVHDYEHWDGRGEFIDFDLELSRLSAEVKGFDPYIVFAKSVGSILTLKAINLGLLKPVKCIFAGLPIKLAEEDGISLPDLIKSNPVPTKFIQNTGDPLASYSRLTDYLKLTGAANYQSIELEGNTHSYDDLNRIKSIVQSFVYHSK
jgi:hypothetical protein